MAKQKNIPLALIFLVVFVDLLGFGILIPVMPAFAVKGLGVSEFYVGLAIAMYSFVQFLFNPFFGSMSDSVGRKKMILIALSFNAVGYVVFANAETYLMLLGAQVIIGIGGSSIGVAQAYIADVTSKEDRARGMGLIGVAFGLGFVFGPFIGGLLAEYGYMVTGLTSAGFSVMAFTLCAVFLPEPTVHKGESKGYLLFDREARASILKNYAVLTPIVIFFVLVFSMANTYGNLALLGIQQYGFKDFYIGLLFGIGGLTGAIVQGGLIGRLTKMYKERHLIATGALLAALGLGLMSFGDSFFYIAFFVVLLNIGISLMQPTTLSLVSRVSPDDKQGTIMGINQSLASLARMLGPLWGGIAYDYIGYPWPFLTGAFCVLMIFIFTISMFSRYVPDKTPHAG